MARRALQVYLDPETEKYLDIFARNGFSKSGLVKFLLKYAGKKLLDSKGNLKIQLIDGVVGEKNTRRG
jgi:hypothetical protein